MADVCRAGGVLVFCGFEGIGLVDGLESGCVARTGSGIGVRFAIQSADLGCQAASARWLMSAALGGCWDSAVFVLLEWIGGLVLDGVVWTERDISTQSPIWSVGTGR